MNFTRFVSLLEHRGLYFCRSDRLGDPFEGAVPQRWLEKSELGHAAQQEQRLMGTVARGSIETLKKLRPWVMISCWHMNEYESAAMWKLYCQGSDGICVQSTYRLLDDALDEEVNIGQVKYISYDQQSIPLGNLFWPFLYKRRSFEHEREIRAIVCDVTRAMAAIDPPVNGGAWRQVDLDRLIQTVYVVPTASDWIVELVQSVMEKYQLTKPVNHSGLDAEPLG
jgi:hypothetical protein